MLLTKVKILAYFYLYISWNEDAKLQKTYFLLIF